MATALVQVHGGNSGTDTWLSSVLPVGCAWDGALDDSPPAGAGAGAPSSLELHRRLVQLAEVRELGLEQLAALDGVKAALVEKTAAQQALLIEALDTRLASAAAALDPHRAAALERVRAAERAARACSDAMQGATPPPLPEEWAAGGARLAALRDAAAAAACDGDPTTLLEQLSAGLAPCADAQHAPAVEQLRGQIDALATELARVRSEAAEAEARIQQERSARLAAERLAAAMRAELGSLRQLAELAAYQLDQGGMHSNLASAPRSLHADLPTAALQSTTHTAAQDSSGGDVNKSSVPGMTVDAPMHEQLSECAALRQQLEHVCRAADARARTCLVQEQPSPPSQPRRTPHLGDISHEQRGEVGTAEAQQLRSAYRSTLQQVQARYQQELRAAEHAHHEALAQQAAAHTAALAQQAQQQEDSCSRLAAAAAAEAQLRSQLGALQEDNVQLRRQVEQLQQDITRAAASALAVAQVQHEQALTEAKEESAALRAQLRERQAPMLAALLDAATSTAAARSGEADAAHALAQRELQHQGLLQELEALRALHAEPSGGSAGTPAGPGLVWPETHCPRGMAACEGSGRAKAGAEQDGLEPVQPSPMSALITAVLGSGARAQMAHAAHEARRQQQQQQQQRPQQPQQQLQQQQKEQQHSTYDHQLAQLDQVLGLSGVAAATAAGATAAAVPSSKHTAGAGAAASRRCSPPRRVSPAKLAKQQAAAGGVAGQSCARCGLDDVVSPGRCCFHPGMLDVPGPLLYSPEWHACRMRCSGQMPGCHTRREHYFAPQLPSLRPGSAAAKMCRLQHGSSTDTTAEMRPRSVLPRPITPRRARK